MSNAPSNEQIETRAYEIYLERGREDGHDVEDWIAAETELQQRQNKAQAIFEQEEPESKKVGYAAAASSRRK